MPHRHEKPSATATYNQDAWVATVSYRLNGELIQRRHSFSTEKYGLDAQLLAQAADLELTAHRELMARQDLIWSLKSLQNGPNEIARGLRAIIGAQKIRYSSGNERIRFYTGFQVSIQKPRFPTKMFIVSEDRSYASAFRDAVDEYVSRTQLSDIEIEELFERCPPPCLFTDYLVPQMRGKGYDVSADCVLALMGMTRVQIGGSLPDVDFFNDACKQIRSEKLPILVFHDRVHIYARNDFVNEPFSQCFMFNAYESPAQALNECLVAAREYCKNRSPGTGRRRVEYTEPADFIRRYQIKHNGSVADFFQVVNKERKAIKQLNIPRPRTEECVEHTRNTALWIAKQYLSTGAIPHESVKGWRHKRIYDDRD